MTGEIIDLQLAETDKLRQRLPFDQPIHKLDQSIGGNNRTDDEVGLVVLVGEHVEQGEEEASGLEDEEVDEEHEVVLGVGLLLVEFEPQHAQLHQQDDRIDALPPSPLQQVLVPVLRLVAARRQVVGEQGNAQQDVAHDEEDPQFREVVWVGV